MQIVKENPNFISCDCGNIMMMEEGDVDYNMKDDKGQKLSKEAAEHFAKYRLRCDACGKNFCTKCNTTPYHTGRTCE